MGFNTIASKIRSRIDLNTKLGEHGGNGNKPSLAHVNKLVAEAAGLISALIQKRSNDTIALIKLQGQRF